MRLISAVERIQDAYGFHPIRQLLAPGIRMDDPKMVTPVIAETDQGRLLLAREQETGNLRAHGVDWDRVRLFERYVSFDNMVHGSSALPSLTDLVASLAPDGRVEVERDLPYGRYLALKAQLDVQVVGEAPAAGPTVVYRLRTAQVLERFAELRSQGVPVARQVIASRGHLEGLAAYLEPGVDTRFQALDGALESVQADALLSLAPPNVSELTGQRARPGIGVIRLRNSDDVFVLAPAGDFASPGEVIAVHPGFVQAVLAVAGDGVLAVEDGWLEVGTALALADAGVTLAPASKLMSRWREFRDHEDLSFQVIAAQASRYCIEGALDYAEQALGSGQPITEYDVYQRYLDLIHDFRRAFQVPFAIEPFFVNCHAADRCLYPAIPVNHVLTERTKSLKFDAGLKVSIDGVVLGTSDIARTLVTTPEGKEAYGIFTEIVRDKVIRRLRPGSVCEQVHRDCVDEILRHEQRLVEIGLMPEGIDMHAEYGRRNVGHLMGKQESFTTELRPGHTYALHEGAIGAVEIQWPYLDQSIAAEDLWFVAADQTYITSA
jgi:hypothetical protein